MGDVKFSAWFVRFAFFLGLAMLLAASGIAASVNPPALTPRRKARGVTETQHAKRRMRTLARSRTPRSRYATHRRHRYYERFSTSSFASDITEGDVTAGEDPVVRQAAIDALGNMNGTVVAIEPTSGRVLALVNQKLALSSGAQPCSTIKLSVALAALSEGVVSKETKVALGGRSQMDLTTALAHSNNAYFEALGRRLGFEKVTYYAHQYGLGELAGYDISGEQVGTYPEEVIPEISGGMAGAVQYGTARRLGLNFSEEEILGKTGTCSHAGTRYGWFASYANTSRGRVVVVVFLQGGRPTFGPKAAEIAGVMYRNLYDHNFFIAGAKEADTTVSKPLATQ